MKKPQDYIEAKLAEFEENFIVRNYEADAHAEDIHITNRPEEIKSFLRTSLHTQLELIKESLPGEKATGLKPPHGKKRTIINIDTFGTESYNRGFNLYRQTFLAKLKDKGIEI